jgi:5-methylcytosine-specific restriction endonuclease McrA
MRKLHIVQGGIENGDKARLERAARSQRAVSSWIGPKSAEVGDDVAVYIGGYGFYATARVKSGPKPRTDWRNRYGFGIQDVRLIHPAISLASIERHVPQLTWARYPRSITTPTPTIAAQLRGLISERRRTRLPDLDREALEHANLAELRQVAKLKARSSAPARVVRAIRLARVQAIRLYVLRRADGTCEGCGAGTPFVTPSGDPYLEPHHTTRLADGGPDDPADVIALCPTCHRRVHHANDGRQFNLTLKRRLAQIENGAP